MRERKEGRGSQYLGSQARIDRGVFFTHVGLAGQAMRQEFGEQFDEYQGDGNQPED